MDRRLFLQSTCLGALGIALGGAVLDLTNIQTVRASSRAVKGAKYREIPLMIQDTPELKAVGGAYHLEIEDLEKNIIVAHVSEGKYVAVDMKCTHKGCDVSYEASTKSFACPCHGSKFDLTGVPINGPASKPLQSYAVSVTDTEVILQVPVEGEAPTVGSGDSAKVPADSTKSK
jgi:cytochrome b6-f complex iron-sulfur subunit